ncbi:MAG: dicarboxylate/amino acid:cation symporter, partial [Bacteroidetes bacterium SW_10_40_5]
MKRIPIHWQIIGGIVFGILFGLLGVQFGIEEFTNNWIAPFGTIFINLLKLIAIPLILISLINGVSNLKNVAKLSRIGGKTIGIYMITTVIAITVGLIFVNIMQPGKTFSEEKQMELREQHADESAEQAMTAKEVQEEGPLQFLVDIVPQNFFNAVGDNSKMLQVIFFSLLFGIAMVIVPDDKTKTLKNLLEGLNDIILKIVELIMRFAPIGVFALLAGQITDFAGEELAQLFEALGYYSLTVVLGLAFLMFLLYPTIISIFTKLNYKQFIQGIGPAQMLG